MTVRRKERCASNCSTRIDWFHGGASVAGKQEGLGEPRLRYVAFTTLATGEDLTICYAARRDVWRVPLAARRVSLPPRGVPLRLPPPRGGPRRRDAAARARMAAVIAGVARLRQVDADRARVAAAIAGVAPRRVDDAARVGFTSGTAFVPTRSGSRRFDDAVRARVVPRRPGGLRCAARPRPGRSRAAAPPPLSPSPPG